MPRRAGSSNLKEAGIELFRLNVGHFVEDIRQTFGATVYWPLA